VHEAAAKEWLKISQPEPNFQTPRKTLAQCNDKSGPLIETPTKVVGNEPDSLEIETPFTKAKRRKVTIDATKSNKYNDVIDQSATGSRDPFRTAGAQETPPGKAVQIPVFSTSVQRFAEKLKIGTDPLPTSGPEHKLASGNANSTDQLAEILGTSPTSARSKGLASFGLELESSLASTVLELIRSDNVELKPSTEIQIRHEIDLVVDLGNTKVQRYQETISKLHERVDELEQIVLHLTE
jgi:hypothetical protein